MTSNMTKREYLMRLLFPPRCILCGEVIPIGAPCCEGCHADFARLRLAGDDNDLTRAPGRADSHLDGVCASFLYEGAVANAVARYKFYGERSLAREFAVFMAQDFARIFPEARCALALGAPSFERNNDHAERLACRCAQLLKIPYEPRALLKTRKTEKQHELGALERATNLKGAFAVKEPSLIARMSVLLVDDVTTSGGTLNECAKALKAAGAARVYALALCATEKRF